MKLEIEWQRPIVLKDGSNDGLIYNVDHDKLEQVSGVYVFGRRYGAKIEALYVGKATSIRGRVKAQMKNLPLMLHAQQARNGKRVLMVGYFRSKSPDKQKKCLPIIERALIRYFLSEGHDLVNVQGTRLRRHEILSSGPQKTVPELMYVDRA